MHHRIIISSAFALLLCTTTAWASEPKALTYAEAYRTVGELLEKGPDAIFAHSYREIKRVLQASMAASPGASGGQALDDRRGIVEAGIVSFIVYGLQPTDEARPMQSSIKIEDPSRAAAAFRRLLLNKPLLAELAERDLDEEAIGGLLMAYWQGYSLRLKQGPPKPIASKQFAIPKAEPVPDFVPAEVMLVEDIGMSGGWNSLIDAGEVIVVNVPLQTTKRAACRQVKCQLISDDPYVRVDSAEVTCGGDADAQSLRPGARVAPNGNFIFTIDRRCPDRHATALKLKITDPAAGVAIRPLTLTVCSPVRAAFRSAEVRERDDGMQELAVELADVIPQEITDASIRLESIDSQVSVRGPAVKLSDADMKEKRGGLPVAFPFDLAGNWPESKRKVVFLVHVEARCRGGEYRHSTIAMVPIRGRSPASSVAIEPATIFPLSRSHVSSATISYALAEAGDVKISLLDARGQAVFSHSTAAVPAGRNSVTWDGLNQQRKPVQAGRYALVLEHRTEAGKETKKEFDVAVKVFAPEGTELKELLDELPGRPTKPLLVLAPGKDPANVPELEKRKLAELEQLPEDEWEPKKKLIAPTAEDILAPVDSLPDRALLPTVTVNTYGGYQTMNEETLRRPVTVWRLGYYVLVGLPRDLIDAPVTLVESGFWQQIANLCTLFVVPLTFSTLNWTGTRPDYTFEGDDVKITKSGFGKGFESHVYLGSGDSGWTIASMFTIIDFKAAISGRRYFPNARTILSRKVGPRKEEKLRKTVTQENALLDQRVAEENQRRDKWNIQVLAEIREENGRRVRHNKAFQADMEAKNDVFQAYNARYDTELERRNARIREHNAAIDAQIVKLKVWSPDAEAERARIDKLNAEIETENAKIRAELNEANRKLEEINSKIGETLRMDLEIKTAE